MTLPYQPHSETSKMGAETARYSSAIQIDRIVDYIVSCGPRGATGREISDALNTDSGTISARLTDIYRGRYPVKRSKRIRNKGLIWYLKDYVTEESPKKRDKCEDAIKLCQELKLQYGDMLVSDALEKVISALK